MLIIFFNRFKLSKKKASLAFMFCALLIAPGCGKRKPPVPPVEKISQRAEISGTQRGNKITLVWNMPSENTANGKFSNISRIDVYRLLETLNSSVSLSEEEFTSRSTLIAALPVKKSDFAVKQMTYTDTLEFAKQAARLRYAIRFVNSSGQKASFSNFLLIEPSSNVATAPHDLKAELLKDSIRLLWTAPPSNVDGTSPANILGYNVYRFEGNDSLRIINSTPISAEEFFDKNLEFGKRYKYFVRAVSIGNSGEPLESADSETIDLLAQDIFPPDAPAALTIAAAPNSLSVFFAANSESDIAGYKIYRTTIETQPLSNWTLITPDLIKTNTFQDTDVESGKKYFYFIKAVDTAGNESEPSEIIAETAP